MSAVENLNKLGKYLKVNAGKLAVDANNMPTRTTKAGTITGYSTILNSYARELPQPEDPEAPFLIAQWFDYSALFAESATRDKAQAAILLKELNEYLITRSYLVGQSLTMADLTVFITISPIVAGLSFEAKERHLHLSRWFDHIQHVTNMRQPSRQFVSFITLKMR